MFSTFKQRLLLGVYIFMIISIPVGAYLSSQYTNTKSSAQEPKRALPSSKPISKLTSAKQELLNSTQANANSTSGQPSPTPADSSSPTVATSFGPTLSLKATLEGRPATDQSTKLFVGIVEGVLTSNPKFLLNFTVDLPKDGTYTNLSLAGLQPGTQYTALLKGSAQIASSVTFVMSPDITNLNNGAPINMLTGDLNQDNVINSADYAISQKAIGSTPNSANWNENADFNKDGVVNIFDLSLVSKNLGQTGASGAWTSPIPNVATPSAAILGTTAPVGSPEQGSGYWIWVPK